jgi:hypothetical protein
MKTLAKNMEGIFLTAAVVLISLSAHAHSRVDASNENLIAVQGQKMAVVKITGKRLSAAQRHQLQPTQG